MAIRQLDEFQKTLYERMVYFHERGTETLRSRTRSLRLCRSDEGKKVERIFAKILKRKTPTDLERKQYVGHMLRFLRKIL